MNWWDGAGRGEILFTWDLWYGCNYRCSYCWWEMDNLWGKLSQRHKILPPEAWAAVWGRIADKYGEVRIDILGGEPLKYPRADELLRSLSRFHRLVVTTNLSMEASRFKELLEGISPERVHFNASFHPQFAAIEDVIEKALMLRSAGFGSLGILFVTWPPFLPKLAEYHAIFKKAGLGLSPMIFQGRYQGKNYPDDYTGEERKLLDPFLLNVGVSKDSDVKYRLEKSRTFGKMCHSGRVYANVKSDGSVFRCGSYDDRAPVPMGSIFDPAFKLFDSPRPCPYQRCMCLEFRYLDEIYGKEDVAASVAEARS